MITRNWRLTEYRGLSTDTKPKKASNGAMFVEMDTQKVFFYDAENKRWIAPLEGEVEENPDEPTATMYLYGHEATADETPTAYIGDVGYVGEVLPPLPNWDKTAYPYVAIGQSTSDGDYILYGNSVPTAIQKNFITGAITWAFDLSDGGALGFHYDYTDGKWVLFQEGFESGRVLLENVTPVWTNHDIIDKRTDSVYLSATDPIPVYE